MHAKPRKLLGCVWSITRSPKDIVFGLLRNKHLLAVDWILGGMLNAVPRSGWEIIYDSQDRGFKLKRANDRKKSACQPASKLCRFRLREVWRWRKEKECHEICSLLLKRLKILTGLCPKIVSYPKRSSLRKILLNCELSLFHICVWGHTINH